MRFRNLFPWIALTVLLVGCSGSKPDPGAAAAPPEEERQVPVITQTEPMSVAQQMAGQTGVVTVLMTDRGFQPGVLRAPMGGVVKIHLKNMSGKPHNLIVERWGIVTRNLAAGEENYVEFTASEKGEWSFFSDAPGAVEPDFRGILKVE